MVTEEKKPRELGVKTLGAIKKTPTFLRTVGRMLWQRLSCDARASVAQADNIERDLGFPGRKNMNERGEMTR
jgi:hypothetical protein